MTICIAAIASDTEKNKEYVVFATDHMVSWVLGGFEHPIKKYKVVNKSTVAMLAGNPLLLDDLVKVKDENTPYDDLKKHIYDNFQLKMKDIIQKELLDPIGINFEDIPKAVNQPMHNPYGINEVMLAIINRVKRINLATQILLIGFDKSGGKSEAQITEIRQNNISDYRTLNFHTIGSGAMQAFNTLLFQGQHRTENLLTTIYNVYKAKRNAEVLEGVGNETDIFVLHNDGCVDLNAHLEVLKQIYAEELNSGKTNQKLKQIKIEGVV